MDEGKKDKIKFVVSFACQQQIDVFYVYFYIEPARGEGTWRHKNVYVEAGTLALETCGICTTEI